MSHAQSLWLMVAIQLGVFGLSWLAVSLGSQQSRQAFRLAGACNLTLGAGLLLVALRGLLPDGLTGAPANVLLAWGGLAMWASLRRLHGDLSSMRGQVWICAALSLLLLLVDQGPGWRFARVPLLLVYLSLLVGGMVFDMLPRSRMGQGRGPRWVLIGAATVLVALMLWRAGGALFLAQPADVHLDGTGALVFAYVVIASLSLVNAMLAYLVLGQSIARLEALSRRDALTGLYNRRGFDEALTQAWERWTRERRPFALLCIDLDHFKLINDQHGHAAGDEVLVRTSAVVSHELRKVDVLCRLGGDELVAVLGGEDQMADLGAAAQRISHAVRRMRLLPELPTVRLTVSVGATAVGLCDGNAEAVLRRADGALYQAKAEGRDRWQVVSGGP